METFFLIILLLIIVIVLYFLFWPVAIDVSTVKAAHIAPLPKAEGILAPNALLSAAEPFGPKLPDIGGPEDIKLDQEGNFYVSLMNGQIIKMKADGSSYEIYAEVGGRPLGLAFDNQGNLYVANGKKGLQMVTKEREVKSVITEAAGKPVIYASGVAIADDGIVYIAQGSTNYSIDKLACALIEPTGRLLAYDPRTEAVREIISGLYLVNGVAINRNQDYLVFDESGTGRVYLHWLRGPKSGETKMIVNSTPGGPDNVTASNTENLFWVALINDGKLSKLAAKSPLLCKIFLKLPERLFWKSISMVKNSGIVEIDNEGKFIKYLFDGKGIIPNVSCGIEKDGWLYLGNNFGKFIYRIKIN